MYINLFSNLLMITKVVLSAEGFVADITGVGALIGVRSLMYQTIVRLAKLPATIFANVPLLKPLGWPLASS